jgi:glycosyltransferase involved in cell wall biosynthesis
MLLEINLDMDFAAGIAPASERLVLVRNGVPVPEPIAEAARAGVRGRLGLDPAAIAVLFAGELSERKQPLQFAQAVRAARAATPQVVGLIAGDGPLSPRLRSLEWEGLRLLGQRDDVPDLLGASDVFALPSLREGLSYALLEAMALGRPPLVSDAPGNPDAVGDAGLIVPAGDTDELGSALARLAGDAGLRERLGAAARERVRERFSLEAMREGTARVYERALGGGR